MTSREKRGGRETPRKGPIYIIIYILNNIYRVFICMERGEAPAGAVTPGVAGSPGRRGRFSGWHPRRCAASSADFQIFSSSPPPSGADRTLKNCHPATLPGPGRDRSPSLLPANRRASFGVGLTVPRYSRDSFPHPSHRYRMTGAVLPQSIAARIA